MTREKMENHISHLEEKLKVLKADVAEAYAQGSDHQHEVLKKQKLRLKDEIQECQRKLDQLIKN